MCSPRLLGVIALKGPSGPVSRRATQRRLALLPPLGAVSEYGWTGCAMTFEAQDRRAVLSSSGLMCASFAPTRRWRLALATDEGTLVSTERFWAFSDFSKPGLIGGTLNKCDITIER